MDKNQNNGDPNPWQRNKPNNNEPPDISEIFENLKKSLGQLLGGGSGGDKRSTSGGNMPSLSWGMLFALLMVPLVIWGLSGIYIIQAAERGVVLQFGRYLKTSTPGPHWHIPWPIQSVERVNVDQNRSLSIQGQTALTQDENIVRLDMTVQYNVKNIKDFLFEVNDPDATILEVSESAVREVVGINNMDFIITDGREIVASETKKRIASLIDKYKTGIQVTTVNLPAVQPPEPVQAAFADVIKAREDRQRFINEAEAYANSVVPRARGKAKQVLEESKAYRSRVVLAAEGEANRFTALLTEYEKAPVVTRERLYLDAIENVFRNTSKVIVDTEGNNNLIYLPLDRLINNRGGKTGEARGDNISWGDNILDSDDESSRTPQSSRTRQRQRSGTN